MKYSLTEALALAKARKVQPTALGSAEIRDVFTAEQRRRRIFSARTTSATYLGVQKQVIMDLLAGKIDWAAARLKLKAALQAEGYDPATGFPEDPEPVPPAARGSLQDLSSDRRINQILQVQWEIHTGAARRMRETEPARVKAFPAWELVRIQPRRTPRGLRRDPRQGLVADPKNSWPTRWAKAGGPAIKQGRMIAWKWDQVWHRLGDSTLFRDALDTEFSPYWFGSGGGILEVEAAVAAEHLGEPSTIPESFRTAAGLPILPPAVATPSPDRAKALAAALKKVKAVTQGKSLRLEDVISASAADWRKKGAKPAALPTFSEEDFR